MSTHNENAIEFLMFNCVYYCYIIMHEYKQLADNWRR